MTRVLPFALTDVVSDAVDAFDAARERFGALAAQDVSSFDEREFAAWERDVDAADEARAKAAMLLACMLALAVHDARAAVSVAAANAVTP